MWKYFDYANAIYKIMYDKTSDYVSYYVSYDSNNNNTAITETTTDTIHDYSNLIRVDKYNDERNNDRVFPTLTSYQVYSVFLGEPNFIVDNIYLGSAFNAALHETLIKYDISLIVNVTSEITNYYPQEFNYVRYNLYDNNKQSIGNYLEEAYNYIINFQNNYKGNILIHCYMGASRSASMVIYYLMKKYNYSFDEALDFVKKKRNIVNPTFRFTKDLAKSIIIK